MAQPLRLLLLLQEIWVLFQYPLCGSQPRDYGMHVVYINAYKMQIGILKISK